ncbi:MAG: GAF domain-containing protein [Sandaracinaceae bacterium]|nr:GAF domain-containing protein [Sandaracinaceae bacterium]
MSDAVGRARGIEEIFDRALDCLRKALSAERAAVLLFDGAGVMRFAAHHGLSAEYRRAVEGHSPWAADATDPRPVFVEDVCEAPELAALLPVLEREGIRALGFVPLTYGGRLLGKFMVYYRAPHAPDRLEAQVARIVAGHIAFAVAQERSRVALSEAKDELESFFAVVGDAIVVHDGSGGLRYINDAGARSAGFSSVAELRQAMTKRSEMERYAEFFDEAGRCLAVDELPGGIALRERRPAQGSSGRACGGATGTVGIARAPSPCSTRRARSASSSRSAGTSPSTAAPSTPPERRRSERTSSSRCSGTSCATRSRRS